MCEFLEKPTALICEMRKKQAQGETKPLHSFYWFHWDLKFIDLPIFHSPTTRWCLLFPTYSAQTPSMITTLTSSQNSQLLWPCFASSYLCGKSPAPVKPNTRTPWCLPQSAKWDWSKACNYADWSHFKWPKVCMDCLMLPGDHRYFVSPFTHPIA